jgi:hydrophobic/amphiphilic exporter-1 (mainly G- bacteria), HAE1 family
MRDNLFLPRFALKRPVTVAMVFIALIVTGTIAYLKIPVSLIPRGRENRRMGMWISYRNATPSVVERQIARPVEEMMRTMSGLRRVYSSSSRGGCWVSLNFNEGTDMDGAYNQVRDRIDRVMPELPEGVRNIQIRKWSDDDMSILGIDFRTSRPGEDLHQLITEQLKRPLERIDGVANVGMWGTRSAMVRISLSREKVNAHRVSTFRLMRQLQSDNFAGGSGWIYDGRDKIYVRSDSRFRTLEEIRNLPVDGAPGVRLRDVADVALEKPPREWRYRINGERAFGIWVKKEAQANTVDIVSKVLKLLDDDIIKRPQMKGFAYNVYFSQADHIQTSLDQLSSSGLWGGLFAILVLLFFLQRIRVTLVIACAIPLSIIFSLTVFYFMGWTLNTVTMTGLIIAFGMVVDNSIVVVEAIHARRMAGEAALSASLHGASEVGLAITVSTMTTLVVFLPLMFMSGSEELSWIMARLGMPVIFALIGSLVVALVFIPLATSLLMRTEAPKEARLITWLRKRYERGLAWSIDHRFEGLLIAIALSVTITIPMDKVKSSMRGGRWTPSFHVHVDMPRHYDLAKADTIMVQYERFLLANSEKYGVAQIEVSTRRGGGRIWCPLKRVRRAWYETGWDNLLIAVGIREKSHMTKEDIEEDMRKRAPRFAGVKMNLDRRDENPEDRPKTASVMLFGEDTWTLINLADEVERRLKLIPGVTDVQSDVTRGNEELILAVNRDVAQQYGVSSTRIGSTVGGIMRGMDLRRFHTPDREISVWVGLRREDRMKLDQVMNLEVVGETGKRTSVRSLVNVRYGRGLNRIQRADGRTRIRVKAISREKDIGDIREKAQQAMSGLSMPDGYQWSFSGDFSRMRGEETDMQFAMIMAGLFVFLLMGILFESFLLPLSIIIAIPLSFLGVYWLLFALGMKLDMLGNIGTIVLIGVVVNNAIVLVDLINNLRGDGLDLRQAILEGGRHRFRPIVMTTATTVCGLLPISIGDAKAIGMRYDTLGVVMIGGLVVSTVLTLFVVPLTYSLFEDARKTIRRLFGLAVAGNHTSHV